MDTFQSISKEVENSPDTVGSNRSSRCKRKKNIYCSLIRAWIRQTTPFVLQELTSTAWQSYSFLFFRFVIGLSARSFGWIYLVSQLTKVITLTLTDCYNQRSSASASETVQKRSWVCCRGVKNAFHLLGSIGVLFFWPFVFAPCLTCSVDVSKIVMILAYSFPVLMVSCCWTTLELTKNTPAKGDSWPLSQEKHLAKLLQRFTHKSTLGLVLHLITWMFLANSKGEYISAESQGAFAHQTLFILAAGFCATLLYYLASYKTSKRTRKRDKNQDNIGQREMEEHKSTSVRTKVTQDVPSVRQCARLWKLNFQDMDYMRSVFVYILSSNAFNVTMLVLPVYLIESIQSHKLAVAYFPAVVFGGWSLAVVILERLLLIFGYKIMFCTSSIMVSCASIWFLTQSIRLSYLLYFPALTFGFSACVMMMTSQTMLYTSFKYHSSYLIGVDYFTKTLSEALLGFVVFVVMQTFPQGHRSQPSRESDQFLRLVMFLIPAINSAVSFVDIFFYTHIPKEKPSHIQYTRTLQQRLALQENYRADDLVIQEEDLEILQDLPSTNL